MSDQKTIERYVRIRTSLVNKQYTLIHGRRMNDKAHVFWKGMTPAERVEAMANLVERLGISEDNRR